MPRRVMTKDDIANCAKQCRFRITHSSHFHLDRELLRVKIFDGPKELFTIEFDLLSQEDGTYALADKILIDRIVEFLTDLKS